MTLVQTITSILAAVVLFLYGLEGFSRELQQAAGGTFQSLTTKLTSSRWRGFVVGAVLCAFLQSSSAVSSLTVALVDAGAITFRNSLGVLLGANVGTTSTGFLVSFELTGLGPILVVGGTAVSFLHARLRLIGKVIFYLGFVLFALDLVGESLEPVREAPWLRDVLAAAQPLPLAVIAGMMVTVVVQSSSVTSGLAILLTQQGVLDPSAAIALVVGANAGTTITAVVASARMDLAARRAARANVLFNLLGVLALLPFLGPFAAGMRAFAEDPALAVASAHLVFNLGIAAVFLVVLRPFERLLLRVWPAEAPELAAPAEQPRPSEPVEPSEPAQGAG